MNSRDVTYINSRRRVEGVESERPLGSVVNEVKDEVKVFAQTRIAMLISEMRENLQTIRAAAPMMGVGLFFVISAWLVLTGALICLIWVAFAPSVYAPFLAFVIVGIFYLVVGGICTLLAYSSLQKKAIMPRRTIQVLKDDRIWFQNEARTQL
ncbi:MAG TPA: phage holin family protein [Terriglobales bacterium]|nr:phage holin family protein [Terriglobales bacterium]